MIDENKTFTMFGYTSNILSYGSNKKVWKICDICKEERLVQYRKYTNLCFKCALQQKNQSGKNHPFYGKHHSDETKLKMSKSKQSMYDGDKNPMYDKHHTKETKRKQSKALLGEKNPRWKGGKKIARAKADTKRRKLFGFIPHNIPHENFHGHHIDFNHVIFIPKELHMSISHSVINNKNMNLINDAVCDWYLKFQINI